MADINKIKINGTEYNISPEWASTGTNTIAIGTSSTTGVKLGTVASFADSSSTIKSDYIQLKDTGSEFPTLTLGSDTNSVSINGGLIVRSGDVELSGGTITAGYVVSDSATINNDLEVKGDTTISGTLGVTGLTTLGTVTAKGITGSTATIDGLTTINSDLKVTGSSTVSNNITAYSLKLNGNATVNGNISLGSYSENIISSSNKLTLRGSYNGGIEIGGNYGIIKSTDEGIQLGTTSAPGLVLGSKNDVTLGNTSSTTIIDGDSITLGDYIKLSSGYINTYNASLEGSSASFSNDVNISGTLNAKGVLNVTSAATFSNTATVSGALKANSTFTSTGAATFNSTITANGIVTANKGLTAKTSFTSPNISDDGTNVNIYGGNCRIGGDSPNIQRICDSNGYYMSMGTVSRYDPTDYNIAMGVYTTKDHTIGTTMMKAGNYRVVCDSNNGVYIGTYNSSGWNNVLSVYGDSLAIGNSSYGSTTVYGPFTVNNGLTASSLSVSGAASLNSTATVSGALKANSTLSVTGTSTFTGNMTANGAVTANKGLTANTSFASPNISDSSNKLYIGGSSPGIHWYNSGSGYYMSMGTVDYSDPSQYKGVVMGVYSTNNPGEFGTNLGTATTKAGPYRIICDSNSGISIGTYNDSRSSWYNAISIKEDTLNIGGDWNTFSIVSENKATFNNDITLGSYACLYANNSATVKGTLNVGNAIYLGNNISLGSNGKLYAQQLSGDSLSLYSGQLTLGSLGIKITKGDVTIGSGKFTVDFGTTTLGTTIASNLTVSGRINANSGISVTGSISNTNGDISMGSGNLNITKGDVTIGSGCLTVTGSNTSTFNGGLVCKGINAGNAYVGDTTTLGTTKCGLLSVTGTTSLVGGLSVSSSTTTLSETTINGKITMGSGTVTVDPSGNVTIGSGNVTIGQSSGINLKCEYGSTKLGYKIGSGTNTSTTTINGDYIHIGYKGGGNNIRIGTIDTSNYTAIFGTTSICETGGNLTIGTTGYTTSIRGNLNLSSATIDNITLGTTTLGTTTVNKPLTASSTLNVSGVSNLSGIVNAKSTLNVTSAATFNGLTYTKKTLYAQSALNVSGTTTLGGTVTANAAVTANKGLTAKTSFTSPHIFDSYFDSNVYIYDSNIIIGTKGYDTIIRGDPVIINGITITNNLTSNTITLTNANGYSITLPLTKSSTTSSASSTSSGT